MVTFVGQADMGLSTNRIGGSETCFRRLAKSLVKSGHNVDFIVYNQKKPQGYFTKEGDSRFPQDILELRSILTTSKADIFNISPMTIRGALWADLIRLKRRGVRISSIYWMYPVYNGPLVKKMRSAIFNRLIIDKVYGASPRIVNELSKWGGSAQLLNPPIDSEYYDLGKSGRSKNKIKTVGYIGRIGSDKGIEWIIAQDLKILTSDNIRFLVFGYYDPEDVSSVTIHQQLQKKQGIEYHWEAINCETAVKAEKVLNWLQLLDVVVFPYTTLSGTIDIPLLCLEACAAGCHVCSTIHGDLKAVLNNQIQFFNHQQTIKDVIKGAVSLSRKPLDSSFGSDSVSHKYISSIVNK